MAQEVLRMEGITKIYDNGFVANKNITFWLHEGEILALVGENGAGKTTLLKCILGLLSYQGQITLDGAPVNRANIARLSFATCEHSFFPNLTAEEHRIFLTSQFPTFRQKRFHALLAFFELPAHQAIRRFSTGQKNQF